MFEMNLKMIELIIYFVVIVLLIILNHFNDKMNHLYDWINQLAIFLSLYVNCGLKLITAPNLKKIFKYD